MNTVSISQPIEGRARIVALALAIASAAACNQDRGLRYGPAELDHADLTAIQIRGEVLFEDDILGMPMDLALVGDKLVVLDRAADSAVQVIDPRSGKLLRRMGREGSGPGEFQAAISIDPVPGSQTAFWVYDGRLGRQTYIDLDEAFFKAGKYGDRIVNLQMEAASLGPVRTDRNTSLSLGFFESGRLAVFDENGTQVATVSPLPADDDIPAAVLSQAYQATLVAHPTRARFAATNRYANLIEIYDSDGTPVKMQKGPLEVKPSFGVAEDEEGPYMTQGMDTRLGYVDGSSSNDHLFALFSGRTREGGRSRAYMGEYIHVFKWDGTFVGAIQLDNDLVAITVDYEEGMLYGVRHLPTPAVIRYSLADAMPMKAPPVVLAAASTD